MKNKFEIIYTILSETATEEEKLLFRELMKEEDNRSLFQQLQKIWNESNEIKGFKKYDSKRAFYELTEKIDRNKKQRRKFLIISVSSVAAGILFVLGLFGLMKLSKPDLQQSVVMFQTETGNRSVVILPDSSRVWLNSQTQLYYDPNFGKDNRNVKLSGEGYFEIKHSDKPFIVDIQDFKVKVYGTKFNVSSYPDDNSVFTSLESGKISILREGKNELFVEPGQLIIYEKENATFKAGMVDVDKYSAWRSNKMYLNNESLNDLAKKLGRKYNAVISFIPQSLGEDVHYSGVFSDEDISEILDAISIASNLKYMKKENRYIIQYQ